MTTIYDIYNITHCEINMIGYVLLIIGMIYTQRSNSIWWVFDKNCLMERDKQWRPEWKRCFSAYIWRIRCKLTSTSHMIVHIQISIILYCVCDIVTQLSLKALSFLVWLVYILLCYASVIIHPTNSLNADKLISIDKQCSHASFA